MSIQVPDLYYVAAGFYVFGFANWACRKNKEQMRLLRVAVVTSTIVYGLILGIIMGFGQPFSWANPWGVSFSGATFASVVVASHVYALGHNNCLTHRLVEQELRRAARSPLDAPVHYHQALEMIEIQLTEIN